MAVDVLILKLAKLFPRPKQQIVFLINNYDMTIAVLKVSLIFVQTLVRCTHVDQSLLGLKCLHFYSLPYLPKGKYCDHLHVS